MRPSEALAKHRDEVLEIISRYPVSNPRVFGSTARGEDVEGSDLDLLVDPEFDVTTFIHLVDLEHELRDLLSFEVDVLTPGAFSKQMADRVAKDVRPL
ncbi:MAG: nucleotidyltransferase [Rhizobiales bacterium 65-79]|jgi:predicted nucleotidyltransferase|nr:nucleotidyltransferase family protein [Hyphomicrobiales bacterium]OJU04868.1 MAG: nucleotidyltransferase [Rhizobiales bacterium 65-79]